MRRAILIGLAILALLLIAVPPAALYYAVYTESGLKTIAWLIPRRIGRLRIDIQGVHGTAARGITLDRLEIDDTRVHLLFEGISGRVALDALLLQTVHVTRAAVAHALIEVRPPRPDEPREPPRRWRFLPHWLAIRADDVRLASGTLIVPDGQRFDATNLTAAGLVRPRTVRIYRASMRLDALEVDAHGLLRAGNPIALDAAAHATIRPIRQPAWVIDASGKGDLDDLGVAAHFSAPLQADLAGQGLDLTHHWHWRGTARVESVDLRAWGAGGALGPMSGVLAMTADASGFTARGPVAVPSLHAGRIAASFEGSYADRAIRVRRLDLEQASGTQVSATGEIGIVAHGPRLDLRGAWKHFRWPLASATPAVRSESGQYVIEGVRPYALRGSGDLAVQGLDPVGFELEGSLDEKALHVRTGALHAFDGHGQVSGSIAWSPQPAWSAAGTAIDVSPQSLRPDLPGRVTFDFDASGTHFGKTADFSLAIHHLTGELRHLPARADGRIARRDAVWQLADVSAQLGRTALSLDGTMGGRMNLAFRLSADDLALLDPDFKGRLDAQGRVRGPRSSPAVDATATGASLDYRGLSVAALDARVSLDPARGAALAHVTARGLALGPRKLGALTFALDGPQSLEQAVLSVAGASYRVEAHASGTLLDGAWRGELTQLAIRGTDTRLALDAATALSVSIAGFHLDRLCLSGEPARLCADADWTSREWNVSALASGLPLQLLTAGLTPNVQYRGLIGLTAQLGATNRGPAQGRLGVTLAGARMVSRTGDGHIETTSLGSGSVTVNAEADHIDGEVELGGSAAGTLQGRWTIRRTTSDWREMPLEGSLTAATSLHEWAPLYTRNIDRVAGTARASLTLSGTLGTPLFGGSLSVRDGELDLYQYNLELRAAALKARLAGNGIDFDGAARIGGGTASARGHVEWRGGETFGRFTVAGTNLRVVDIPEAQIDASPDLVFSLAGRELAITGTVKVPNARIAPAELANAVSVSPDQVIVGETSDGNGGRLKVSTQISIELGDEVRIATQGLTGRLAGSVLVTSGGEAITRASGELRIADGEYSAYGRQLDIDRGRLIYTASPIDNPGIDIRAVKRFHDPNVGATLAGINVRGTLRQPQITFFSEPPLAQQQIMSLVFAGGTLFGGPQLGASAASNSSRSENAQLIGQGAAVLGSQIGLPVGIEPTYNNDTALMLGKYLSPRLYVSYGITLLQSLNIVKLRYTLGDHWALSTEFGQLGGADIVYTFQK